MRVSIGGLEVRHCRSDGWVGVPSSTSEIDCEQEGGEEGVDATDEGRVVGDRVELVVDVARFALDAIAVVPVLAGSVWRGGVRQALRRLGEGHAGMLQR